MTLFPAVGAALVMTFIVSLAGIAGAKTTDCDQSLAVALEDHAPTQRGYGGQMLLSADCSGPGNVARIRLNEETPVTARVGSTLSWDCVPDSTHPDAKTAMKVTLSGVSDQCAEGKGFGIHGEVGPSPH